MKEQKETHPIKQQESSRKPLPRSVRLAVARVGLAISAFVLLALIVSFMATFGWREAAITKSYRSSEDCAASRGAARVYAVYEYSVDSQKYSVRACEHVVDPMSSATVVNYPPNNPEKGELNTPAGHRALFAFYGAVVVGLIGMFARTLRVLKKQSEL